MVEPWHDETVEVSRDAGRALICGQHPGLHFEHGQSAAASPSCHDLIMASMPLQTISEAVVPEICICVRNDRHGMDAMVEPWHDEKVEFSRDAGRALICGQRPDLHFEHGQSAASPPPFRRHSSVMP